jgi:hypothetical protein
MPSIRWRRTDRHGCVLLCPRGDLHRVGGRRFGDGLVGFAAEQPRALIVEVDQLRGRATALVAACTAALRRTRDWPHVPIVLVARSEALRSVLAGIGLLVPDTGTPPVFASTDAALAELAAAPRRRRVCLDVTAATGEAAQARCFVRETCRRWDVPETRTDALIIVTELVQQAARHGHGALALRLELRDELLTVAVDDDVPHGAEPAEPPDPGGTGMWLVSRLANSWGRTPRPAGGHVAWATLATGWRRAPA